MEKIPFPAELAALRQWVCWRLEPDPKGGKDRKIPYNPLTGSKASSTNLNTWTDCTTAMSAMEQYSYTGLGFVFVKDSSLVGIDIDHCIDSETGELSEIAAAILEQLPPTYIEVSPSGTGLHIFLHGVTPDDGCKNSTTGVEMYSHSRYFTMTGNKYPTSIDTIGDDNGAIQSIHETYIKPKKSKPDRKKKSNSSEPLTDAELIEKAYQSKDFQLLWDGNWQESFDSQSEADMSLCCKLAFWSGRNIEQMDRLFRQSKLYRDKWDERHHANGSTYGEETLTRAAEVTENVYSPNSASSVFRLDDRYFRNKGDKIYPITNYIIEPIEILKSDEETQYTADFVTSKVTEHVSYMSSDTVSLLKFKNVLNKKTNHLLFFGTEGDLEYYKEYVNSLDWIVKKGVTASGIYEHDGKQVFVSTKGAVTEGGTPIDSIVQLERQQGIVSDILSRKMINVAELNELGSHILTYNEPIRTVSILAWIGGCFIKPQLRETGIKYPHLFLIGESGSGKSTTLEHMIMPVFSRSKIKAASQITQFTLLRESASSNLIPQAFDEFKPSKIDRYKLDHLNNHFREAYDMFDNERGRTDQQTVQYKLLAPIVVAGEESADETAIRDRTIELLFAKKDLQNANYRSSFNAIREQKHIIASFGRSLLDTALSVNPASAAKVHDNSKRMFDNTLSSRVISNLACAYSGLRLIEKLCKNHGLSWDNVFPIPLKSCAKYLEAGVHEYLFDGGESNKTIVEQTFEVMARMNLDPNCDYELNEDGSILSLWLNHIYDKYTKYRREYAVSGEVLSYNQFRKQLEHSDYFIAKNVQKWIGSDNRRVWQVNFTLLSKRCDVSGFENDAKPLTDSNIL